MLKTIISLLATAGCFCGFADTLRITSWQVQSATTDQLSLNQAAATLTQLNPDIILLDGVRDWQSCNGLVQALKPAAYQVALCTAFRDPATGVSAPRQLAILSKQKPYFFWSEPWRKQAARAEGGFAFAALQTREQRLGFYLFSARDEAPAQGVPGQLIDHVREVKEWEANRVQTFIIGGSFSAAPGGNVIPPAITLLREQGFADLCFDLGSGTAAAGPQQGRPGKVPLWLLAERTVCGVNPQELVAGGQVYLTCDVELEPARVAAAWSARAQGLERRSLLAKTEGDSTVPDWLSFLPASSRQFVSRLLPWWWVGCLGVACLLLFFIRLRRRRALRLPAGPSPALLGGVDAGWNGLSYSVVISPDSGSPLRGGVPPGLPPAPAAAVDERTRKRLLAGLGRWLEQKVVRTLAADREQLLDSQESAALKVKAVDERLDRIERQIQIQTLGYEQKIQELTQELAAAKEENRELIRVRIAQVKSEMAAVRARVLAAAQNED